MTTPFRAFKKDHDDEKMSGARGLPRTKIKNPQRARNHKEEKTKNSAAAHSVSAQPPKSAAPESRRR
jgi:hypothetical protein